MMIKPEFITYLIAQFNELKLFEKVFIAFLLLALAYVVINIIIHVIMAILEIITDLARLFRKAFRKHFWAIVIVMILIACYFKLK